MESGSIFKTKTSQAVRLPKAVSFPSDVKRVDIISLGRALLIVPHGEGWDSWFEEDGVTCDFMTSRDQPVEQVRDAF